jgi:hypothetical protein
MRYLHLIIVIVVLFTTYCDNPFLPPRPDTDRPIELIDPRHSPEGVINQLIKSYEYRNIGLYTSLLASDFRFYVSSGFDQTEKKYTGPLEPEKPDTFIDYHQIDKARNYLYWNLKAEVSSTQKMFSQTRSIEIDLYQIDAPVYHCDSLYAEVVVSNLQLDIITDAGDEYKIGNEPQVFVLKRIDLNGSKFWVIWKWYDLGSES